MAERRRYTKAQKAEAVTVALGSSTMAAAEQTGIPRKTLAYWMDDPEYADLRQKTREQIAEGSMVLANLAQAELTRKVKAGEVEPRDLAVIYGIAIDKAQLLAGMATARTETRTLTDGLDDHEKQLLRDLIDGATAESAEAGAGSDPVGVGADVRQ
jgi:transposase-like protein